MQTLHSLHDHGLRLAIVTNKPEAATFSILADLALARFFDAVIGGDTLAYRKPHPAPVSECLGRLGVGAADALMLGDNHHDVLAAQAAGLKSVLVSYGYAHGDPRAFAADLIIDRFSDLPRAMETLGHVFAPPWNPMPS